MLFIRVLIIPHPFINTANGSVACLDRYVRLVLGARSQVQAPPKPTQSEHTLLNDSRSKANGRAQSTLPNHIFPPISLNVSSGQHWARLGLERRMPSRGRFDRCCSEFVPLGRQVPMHCISGIAYGQWDTSQQCSCHVTYH